MLCDWPDEDVAPLAVLGNDVPLELSKGSCTQLVCNAVGMVWVDQPACAQVMAPGAQC